MQSPGSFLQFEHAPLNLREVLFCVCLENTNGPNDVGDFDLFSKLIEAALEHAVSGGLLAAAQSQTALRSQLLDVENKRAEDVPIERLVPFDAGLLVVVHADRFSNFTANCQL